MPHPKLLPLGSTAALLFTIACGNSGQPAAGAPGGRGGAPPPAAVKIVTLSNEPIEEASDFIATLRSLRSTTIQPEVDGVVTRIFVKPGDRVSVGSPLLQINAEKQRASVGSTEASRAGIVADVEYWRQQVKRLATLVEAGAISRVEFEQAQ